MNGKRTTVDFSQHELIIEETDKYSIHWLKKPDSVIHNVKFINIEDSLLVTGDFGHWSFRRNFYPEERKVSDYYWIEKLAETQKGVEFSSEKTAEQIRVGIKSGLKEEGYEGKQLEELKDFYEELLLYVDDAEWEYKSIAYGTSKPEFLDDESVPYAEETHSYLKCVFDAFEEVSKRVIENNFKKIKNVCNWELSGDFDFYNTSCGKSVYHDISNFAYCPYCGKEVK